MREHCSRIGCDFIATRGTSENAEDQDEWRHKISGAAAALVMVVGGGGVAYAFWTAPGGGTSTSMNVKDALPVVVTQTATLTDPRPGVALPISGLITNPNAAEVAIGLLNPQVTSVVSDKGVTLNPMDYPVTGSAVHARKVPAGSCHGVASS